MPMQGRWGEEVVGEKGGEGGGVTGHECDERARKMRGSRKEEGGREEE